MINLDTARQHLRDKIDLQATEWMALHQKATVDTKAIIAMIVERYRPTRIYQWGSLLKPDLFRDYSDIDIAVEGLRHPADLLHLLRDAEALTGFPLDIVELDHLEAVQADTIRQKGKCVYEH